MHKMREEDSSTAMEGTASVLELENRRLFEPQKHRKRVSFKDEAWVINIPPCEESHVNLRRSVILSRNAVANGTLIQSRRPSLETFSTRASLYANRDQSPQAHSCRILSSGHATHRGPYKSILKTSTPSHQKEDHLHRSQMSAGHFRDFSARNSVDHNYFKQGSRHLLPSKDSVNRLEKDAFTRPLPAKRSPIIPRTLGSDNDFSYNKTGRFVGKEYLASGRPAAVELNYNQYHIKRGDYTKNTATEPTGANFNIVGVTYRSVNEMPYFYDIRGQANRMNEYSSGTKSTLNGQACLEHSSVPKPLNQFGPSKREERHYSAIPAIEAFNRRNRGTRRHFSSAWNSEQATSPKTRQLPIAWQPAKQYNFSTK